MSLSVLTELDKIKPVIRVYIERSARESRYTGRQSKLLLNLLNQAQPSLRQILVAFFKRLFCRIAQIQTIVDGVSPDLISDELVGRGSFVTGSPFVFISSRAYVRRKVRFSPIQSASIREYVRCCCGGIIDPDLFLYNNGGLILDLFARAVVLHNHVKVPCNQFSYFAGTNGHLIRRLVRSALSAEKSGKLYWVDHDVSDWDDDLIMNTEYFAKAIFLVHSHWHLANTIGVLKSKGLDNEQVIRLRNSKPSDSKIKRRLNAKPHSFVNIGYVGAFLADSGLFIESQLITIENHLANLKTISSLTLDKRFALNYRAHPSSQGNLKYIQETIKYFDLSRGETYLDWLTKQDVLILDSVNSNAFNIALMSNLPIILLLPQKLISNTAITQILNRRCWFLDINSLSSDDFEKQISYAKQLMDCNPNSLKQLRDIYGFLLN